MLRTENAALRRQLTDANQRAEKAERERDEARELVRKQFKAGDWFDKEPVFYDVHELARDAIARWDACEARTAAAPPQGATLETRRNRKRRRNDMGRAVPAQKV